MVVGQCQPRAPWSRPVLVGVVLITLFAVACRPVTDEPDDAMAGTAEVKAESDSTDGQPSDALGHVAADTEESVTEPAIEVEPVEQGTPFVEDFVDPNSMARFEIGLFHRDDELGGQDEWMGDHPITGPDDLCGPPTEKRIVARGERQSGFNDEWVYRCIPGGDLDKAHVMTSIGHTSGYSIGAFAPVQEFTGVREIRWDVNQTDLGDRQWTEVAVIPASNFDMQNLPCTTDVPCDTTTHDELGSVGTQWAGQRARRINTPEQPGGYMEAGGDLGYRCDTCPYAPSKKFGEDYGAGDPALTSLVIRRENFFRDNGDGTLTWGFQLEDGSFEEFTAPGSFPDGPVRVAFKDHNYTPLKSPATLLPETFFTWHWDNIQILTDEVAS